MEHIYIKDTITDRSLWITRQYEEYSKWDNDKDESTPAYRDYYSILTDGMLFREPIKESSIRKTIKDWMKWIPTLDKVKEAIEFMELYEYTGEPTEQEMEQRLTFWKSWSPNAYRDNHLRINHPCPCCGSDVDTEWVREEWNICYSCMIAFSMEDLTPVVTPEEYARIRLEEEVENEWYE